LASSTVYVMVAIDEVISLMNTPFSQP